MFEPEDEPGISNEVGDLIDQLKTNTKRVNKIRCSDEFELKPEELEQFILNSTGKLVQDSMDMVSTVKEYVECAPDSDGVTSLAELLRATTSSIDTLSKLLVQDKREKSAVKLKQIDIAAKHQLLEAEHSNKKALTRKEVLDELMHNAQTAEIVDAELDQDSSDSIV
jgi:hypothetical protein